MSNSTAVDAFGTQYGCCPWRWVGGVICFGAINCCWLSALLRFHFVVPSRFTQYFPFPDTPLCLLIWDFQYDSYVSASCRFGLLDYYSVPNSPWVASLIVYCYALSLGSSLFSEVLRTSSLLGGLTHEFSARLASTLWYGMPWRWYGIVAHAMACAAAAVMVLTWHCP